MAELAFQVIVLDSAVEYIRGLKESDGGKIKAQLVAMQGKDGLSLYTKQLYGPIRELIIKQHRLIYFLKDDTFYFVDAFKKQSAKTPKRIIEHAKEIYKTIL